MTVKLVSAPADMDSEPLEASADPSGDQLRGLTAIGRALTYATTLEQVARLAVERGATLLDASSAVIMLPDSDELLQVRASHGIDAQLVARFRAPLSDDLTTRLQGLLDVTDDRFLAVPLIVGGSVTGLMGMALRAPYTEADEWLLSAHADQIAVALENARLGGEVRVEMEARLRASEGATSAKDRALATLAHDIRSPLGSIEAYSELLSDGLFGPVTDKQREAIARIRMSGRHLLSLLDSVMDMARLNAGIVRLSNEPVVITDVAREAVEMLLPMADAKLQALSLGERAAVRVKGDHGHLRQVLVNLIGNAIKFTPADGTILVTTGVRTIDGERWGEIRVCDSGPGIAEHERAQVLEPFYRSEGTAQEPGVGLGLAISNGLVQQMGGTLELESEVGAGSTFIVRLAVTE